MFSVRRASMIEALGPQVIAAAPRALKKGHTNGPKLGDPWRMPGLFAVRDEGVVWSHHARHAADHPDFSRIPELLEAGNAECDS